MKEIPGLSTKVVEDLIAEIGLDMEVFPTEKNLASWAGMSPGNNESRFLLAGPEIWQSRGRNWSQQLNGQDFCSEHVYEIL